MIHANRIVTVGEQESIIDRPIILYRGDREVEIEFTLVGNEFTFSEDGNVIKSVNASHGQLVLNTPSGEHMFSELAECHEGKVVFVVTKEMIDEFIEMGFYSFQIRLYDSAEMKSRVTIPPVMNGFDIRNPIAAEDETNIVDQGLVDYARIFKDQSNEELPTFDWTGAYNKTEWEHHDVITENKLNKIEDALYSINATTKELSVDIPKTLDQVKKDADKYVKEHMAEVEADVEEFERNINTDVQKFKIDTNAAMTAHKNEVSEVVDGLSSQLVDIVTINLEVTNENDISKDLNDAFLKLNSVGGGILNIPFNPNGYNVKNGNIIVSSNTVVNGNNNVFNIPSSKNNKFIFHCQDISDFTLNNLKLKSILDIETRRPEDNLYRLSSNVYGICITGENLNFNNISFDGLESGLWFNNTVMSKNIQCNNITSIRTNQPLFLKFVEDSKFNNLTFDCSENQYSDYDHQIYINGSASNILFSNLFFTGGGWYPISIKRNSNQDIGNNNLFFNNVHLSHGGIFISNLTGGLFSNITSLGGTTPNNLGSTIALYSCKNVITSNFNIIGDYKYFFEFNGSSDCSFRNGYSKMLNASNLNGFNIVNSKDISFYDVELNMINDNATHLVFSGTEGENEFYFKNCKLVSSSETAKRFISIRGVKDKFIFDNCFFVSSNNDLQCCYNLNPAVVVMKNNILSNFKSIKIDGYDNGTVEYDNVLI